MNEQKTRLRNAGFVTFFFSGICAISSGVVVSLLQEQYGFAYGMTGTLLSLMSIGNLLAGFLTGVLPGVLGLKPSILLLTIGYTVGYGIMGFTGAEVLLAAAFFLVGVAKGSVVQSKHLGKDFMAGMKTLVGGEIESYTQMLTEARQIATKRMVDDAEAMYRRALAFAATRELTEFRAEISDLRDQLRLLAETERLDIKNVL